MDDEVLRPAVYSALAATGLSPDRHALAGELGVAAADVDAGMERLAAARHVVLGPAGDVVLAAREYFRDVGLAGPFWGSTRSPELHDHGERRGLDEIAGTA
jgi:hypothetical protein